MFSFAKAVFALSGALTLTAALGNAPARAQTPEAPPATFQDEEETPRRSRIRIGPQVGVFLPTDSKTRDRFGASWVSFGVGLGPVRQAVTQGRVGFDLNLLYKRRGDNRVLLAPIGVSYRRALAEGDTSPYAGASLNVVLVDLRSPADNVGSGLQGAGGGSVFVGATLRENAFIEARYLAISRVRGFNLSGLNLTAGVRF